MSNEKKNATLGMPHGTAAGRLRKMLLFDCLKRHDENICVRCSKPILLIEELSIEHIKPWEGRSAELFWDLTNIAFAHTHCNVPHVRNGGAPRKVGPEGMAWCTNHQRFLPLYAFSKNANHWHGLDNECKECRQRKY